LTTREAPLRTQDSGLRTRLASPWLTIRVQLALGAIFVAAALPKIVDPPSFAHMIFNYRLVPGPLVNLMALTMPWVELFCGLALILGIWTDTARAIIGAMLAAFMIAISINLARGNAIDCGCFDVSAAGRTRAERLDDMRFVILRDVGMLLMVGQLWWAKRRRASRALSDGECRIQNEN
jgi:putative oxidoreductase